MIGGEGNWRAGGTLACSATEAMDDDDEDVDDDEDDDMEADIVRVDLLSIDVQ